jgi:uncharacterized membrane protein YhaH (DUF805 family)
MVALASSVGLLVLDYAPPSSKWSLFVGSTFIVIVLTLSAFISQKWTALTALCLVLVGSNLRERWRYLLVAVALASWLAMLLLNYVSHFADWFVDLFRVCWLALFFLAWAALFRRRWRELAISGPTLFITFLAFAGVLLGPEKGGLLPNAWLQETGFRIYAAHLIRATPSGEFLSKCKLVDYVEEDGTRQQVGECDDGLRSTLWFSITVIYDPTGQLAGSAIHRTLAWRLAVLHLHNGRFFVHDDVAEHLVGNYYWIVVPPDLSGDDGK